MKDGYGEWDGFWLKSPHMEMEMEWRMVGGCF